MNGQLIANALRAAAAVFDTDTGSPANTGAPVLQPATQTQLPPATQPGGAAITADAITALIQPHIGNDAIKGALGVAMRAMGINALPETLPHQYAPLYQAFQNVIAQHTGGGLGGAPPSASII